MEARKPQPYLVKLDLRAGGKPPALIKRALLIYNQSNMTNISTLKIIDSDSVDELREVFCELCSRKLKFYGYDLVMFPEDFDHCCYEYLTGGIYKGKFSLRRARKILLIEQICNIEIEHKIIHQTARHNQSLIIISEVAEFCFIILPVNRGLKKHFRLLTMIAFGKGVEGGMGKFLKAGNQIDSKELKTLFAGIKNEG